jgi:hypothetical protein
MYVNEAWLHDKALVESWKSDMDGILIFVRALVPTNSNSPTADMMSLPGRSLLRQRNSTDCGEL